MPKVISNDPDFAPYTIGGSVYVSHRMNGDRCRGLWRLLKFVAGGKGFHCRVCNVFISDSAPNMFEPIMKKLSGR